MSVAQTSKSINGKRQSDLHLSPLRTSYAIDVSLTEAQVESLYGRFQTEVDWALTHFQSKVPASVSMAVAMWMPIAPAKIDAFAEQVRTGANLPAYHPALLMRDHIATAKARTTREVLALFTRAARLAEFAVCGTMKVGYVKASGEAWHDLVARRQKAGLP